MPAATPSRRVAPLPREERRGAIIAAVIPLLTELGLSATTRQIAEVAGVSEGTIFNVFADKDELLEAVIEAALDPAPLEAAIAAIDDRLPFEERLVSATELVQRRIVDIWRLLSQLARHHPREHRRRTLPDSAALTELMAADAKHLRVPPADAARMLRALTLALTHPMLCPEPRSAAEIVDQFLYGSTAQRRRAGQR